MVIARDPPLATLHELNTVYSLRDLYDLIEIAAVDAFNQRVYDEHYRKQAERNNRGFQ
jgi:hypothetical protein